MSSFRSTLPAYQVDPRFDETAEFESATTERMLLPSATARAAWFDEPENLDRHDVLLDSLAILHQLEVSSPPRPRSAGSAVRIAFWNAERCRSVSGSLSLVSSTRPDVVLLAEMDVGMVRSKQRHTVGDLATGFGAGYLFGIEFIELSPGNHQERVAATDIANAGGLHGNAIVTALRLTRPALIRFDRSGRWWNRPSSGQKRIGGRMAVVATLMLDEQPVTLAAVHLESHSDPAHRALQMDALLTAIEAYAPSVPAVIGGDLNTSTFSRDGLTREAIECRKKEFPAERLADPVPYEPLFEVARRHGFNWSSCNVMGMPTQRPRPNGLPEAPFCKLDWFLTRGVTASDPVVVPATHPASGSALSDHEMIAITISAV